MAVEAVTAALAEMSGISSSTDSEHIRRASRDMSAVLSPTLAAGFADRQAEAVVMPGTEEQVMQALAACARHRVPVVPRGAGTCNFGQSVPLRGGVVLDLTGLTGMVTIEAGSWRARAGTLLSDVDEALAPTGQELRVYPSSKRIGTVGGYVVGGHAGIGAIRHGVLADEGNIMGLRVLTVEESPRVVEIRGDDVNLVHFSFGTTGLVTEVEMPAAKAWAWRDVAYAFADLNRAAAFALAVMIADGIDVKNVHPVDAEVVASFSPLPLPAGKAAALCMVAPHSLEALTALAARHGGHPVLDVATGEGPRGIPMYEYTWGHSVWWLRKVVPTVAAIIALLPESDPLGALAVLRERLQMQSWIAISCKRFAGKPALQLALCVDGSDPSAVPVAAAIASNLGCLVADTHRPVLSAASIYAFGDRQQKLKARVDPYGLLNPGKIDGADADEADSSLSGSLTARGFSERRESR
jgi:FAD/FMN-containing dehydrogenase